jgi:hypothetical protein
MDDLHKPRYIRVKYKGFTPFLANIVMWKGDILREIKAVLF